MQRMTRSDRRTPSITQLGELLTPPQVAQRLGVRLVTLADWRFRGRGPRWVRVGRLVRYPSALLEAWLAERLQGAA